MSFNKSEKFSPLHWFDRNEVSTVTIGYLVIAMTLYATVAGIWNTGVVVNQKIKTQVVADVAAHGAATRMAAGLNEMAMLNMLAMRSRAALTVYYSCVATSTVGYIAGGVLIGVYAARLVASLGTDASAWAQLALVISDLAGLTAFTVHYTKAKPSDLRSVFKKVSARQKSLAGSLTADINSQLGIVENYLEVKGNRLTNIYVSHPDTSFYPVAGSSSTSYLFNKAGYLTRLMMIATRVAFADAQWLTVKNIYKPPEPQDAWKFPVLRSQSFFNNFRNEFMPNIMRVAMYASLAISIPLNAIPEWGYKLKSQSGLSEWSGNKSSDRRIMQVVAVAERIDSQKTFMAKGFFKKLNAGNSVVAVAQAEAGNPYDEIFHYMLGDIPMMKSLISIPWRMWSSMGVNYQGRLTRVDPVLVRDALLNNTKMKNAWVDNTGGKLDMARSKDVFLH
ncbi:MAG: hypothetical protein ACYTFY_06345 [Planctomycetota bacterium]|jgi:hypothetical protein